MNSVTLTMPIAVPRIASDAEVEAAAALARRQRIRRVYFWRSFILVLALGGWELLARLHVIDEFFFSKPSDVVMRLYTWTVEGTAEGPLWYHLWVTMEESLLGFLTGAAGGVVAGIALGRNRMLSDVFSVYIKVINSIPRVVLAPIFMADLPMKLRKQKFLELSVYSKSGMCCNDSRKLDFAGRTILLWSP